ncbi:type II pantothenate kinase [Gautieria morchelliformis]|nr:type II pantothenate kinase [Gautieria morchelliformis]
MAVARPSSALMSLPTPKAIKVDTRGAVILHEESPETRDSRGIYLPNYIEPVSHIAVDIGGSLAKVVPSSSPGTDGCSEDVSRHLLRSGALTPLALESSSTPLEPGLSSKLAKMTLKHFPGGSLNFERFETSNLEDCVAFIRSLITRSATVNGVTEDEMKRSVKIMATGGGAHRFHELFSEELGVEVRREDEMECLIEGLGFITHIPDEVYFFSDELIHSVSHPDKTPQNPPAAYVNGSAGPSQLDVLERPSPNPPQYNVSFATDPSPQFPCLLVNIGSGVSIIKVDEGGTFERVSGTSLGGGTLWGLLSLLTPATSFDEMLALSEQGDNATVDMLVGDIYGQDYSRLGLKSTMIASSFGKVFKKGEEDKGASFPLKTSAAACYTRLVTTLGKSREYMNAEKYGLDKIYFGGCFIRGVSGYAATVTTLSYAIRFWSKGTKRALFLRHEGFLVDQNIEVQDVDQRINGR